MNTDRILLLQSLILLLSFARAQLQPESTNDSNYYVGARISPVAAIITAVLLSVAFLLWLFWHYNHHYIAAPAMRHRHRAAAMLVRRGIDAAVIDSFPTFTYAEVKEHKIGKSVLECAICLSEFEDHETLRLIPKCDHVFHPECIDTWLESNVTCPVCRANLTPQTGEEPVHPLEPWTGNIMEETNSRTGEIVIQLEGDDANPNPRFDLPLRSLRSWSARTARVVALDKFRSHWRSLRSWSARTARVVALDKFRSHWRSLRSWSARTARVVTLDKFRSHSVENLDRFTLRLPNTVRKEMMDRTGSNRPGRCVATILSKTRRLRRGFRSEEWSGQWGFFSKEGQRKRRSSGSLEPTTDNEAGLMSENRSKSRFNMLTLKRRWRSLKDLQSHSLHIMEQVD